MKRLPLVALAVSVAALGFLLAGASGDHVVDVAGVCHGHNKSCTRPTTTTSPTTTDVTTTAPTPPPPPPPGPAVYDKSATLMTCLYKTTPDVLGECPTGFWDDLGFTDNDVQLVADPTFGQVYRHRTKAGSGNGYYHCPATCAASYLGHYHSAYLGATSWFSDSIKVESPYTCTDWGLVWQLNYGQSSPPMALALNCGQNSTDGQLHFGVYRNGGVVSCIGCQPSSAQQQFTQLDTGGPFLDRWVDFVVGVRWSQTATDLTGWYEVYTRTRANGETGFTLRDSRSGILTMQFCTCGIPATLQDKQDQYFGYWDSTRIPASGFPTNYVDHRGLSLYSTKADAILAAH